ncbi:MAG: hypothetical protein ACE5KT_05450 [Methanosarcinales archaeon]
MGKDAKQYKCPVCESKIRVENALFEDGIARVICTICGLSGLAIKQEIINVDIGQYVELRAR